MSPQGDRVQGGEPHVGAERRHRLRPHVAAAGERGGQHGHAHGLPEPGGGAHPQPVQLHLPRWLMPGHGDTHGDEPGGGDTKWRGLGAGLGCPAPQCAGDSGWRLGDGQRWCAVAQLEPPGHGWKDGDTTGDGGTDPPGMGPLGMRRAGRSRGWDRWPASVLPNKEPVQP